MEIFKVISMYVLGIAGIVKGVLSIRKNTGKPFKVILLCLLMSIGVVGYALYKKILFIIIAFIGFVLIFILG